MLGNLSEVLIPREFWAVFIMISLSSLDRMWLYGLELESLQKHKHVYVCRDLLDTNRLHPVSHGPTLLLRSIQTQVDVFLKYTSLFQAWLGM